MGGNPVMGYISLISSRQPSAAGNRGIFAQNRLNNSQNCAILKSINQNYGGVNVKADRACKLFFFRDAIIPNMRKSGIEIAKPIVIGNNVWIGAGSTILAGAAIEALLRGFVILGGCFMQPDLPGRCDRYIRKTRDGSGYFGNG